MSLDEMTPAAAPDPTLEGTAVLRAMATEVRKSDNMPDSRARCFMLSRLSREQTMACAQALDLAAGEIDRQATEIISLRFELESARQTFGRVKQSMRELYDAGYSKKDTALINSVNDTWDSKRTPEMVENHGRQLLWGWFGLSYASFLTLPRVMLHAMPDHWQGRLALLLEEFDEAFPGFPNFGFRVQAIKDKKLVKFPEWILNYRRPDFDEVEKCRSYQPRAKKLSPAASLTEMES